MLSDTNMIILLFALLSLAAILLIIITLRLKDDKDELPTSSEFQGTSGLRGRLEKLEHALNDLQTDALRSIEISSGRIDGLQKKVNFVEKHLEINIDRLISEAEDLNKEVNRLVKEASGDSSADEKKKTDSSSEVIEPALVYQATDLEQEIAEHEIKENLDLSHINEVVQKQEVAVESLQKKLSVGLSKSRQGLFSRFKGLLSGKPKISSELLEEAEALLIGSDLGVACSQKIIAAVKDRFSQLDAVSESDFWELIKEQLQEVFSESVLEIIPQKQADVPLVVLVVGVNGVGKTTSIAKLANQWKDSAKVLLIAADTFRAAAVEQLKVWADKVQVDVFCGDDSQKPATVVFDGLNKAKAENYDVVIIDTAGRLHNKANLMQELEGISNVIKKFSPQAPHEVLLVVDACTGQNALSQAQDFNEIIKLSGIVITKLDGTPKGGIVVAIKNDLGIPVRYIGVGEGANDLQAFDSKKFIAALVDFETETLIPENHFAVNAETRRMRRS